MRFSMLPYGVLATLVGVTFAPSAGAQSADSAANSPEDANARFGPNPVAFVFEENQDLPAKTDEGRTNDAAEADKQVQAEVLLNLARDSQSQHQGQSADVNSRLGEWVRQYQGANQQGQPNTFWAWTKGQDALWFDHPHERSSGIILVPVDEPLRSHLKLPKDEGLLVASLVPQSPAAAAGLHQNDVLLKLGDATLGKPEDLESGLKAAGDKAVVLHIYRDGSALEVRVQPQVHVSFGPVSAQPPAQQFWIGVSVAEVEPALRAQLRIPANKGLLVNQVFKDSPAEKAGVRVNDILLSFDGKPLTEQMRLVELVQANGEKTVKLELLHEGRPRGDVELTPQRHRLTQVADPTKALHAYRWDVVRPGAVLNSNQPLQFQFRDLTPLTGLADKLKDPQTKDANAALAKRLDELDAEIKKLHKALEELSAASKVTQDLNRAIELLQKLSADKK
jgi:membrane-associated protease RseP (regulator of RpoE activity)